MATPEKKDIMIGIAFVFVGLANILCDRWPYKVNVKGCPQQRAHAFEHTIITWFLKQFLQMWLMFIWLCIDKKWLGCARFRHGDVRPRRPRARNNRIGHHRINEEPLFHNGNDYGAMDAIGHDRDQDADAPRQVDVGIEEQDDDGDIDEAAGERRPLLTQAPEEKDRKNKGPSVFIYFPAAVFEFLHIMLIFFGVKLTYPSSFLMLQGSLALFTALLSMAFLAQQLACHVWFGVVVSIVGFVVSGISDYIHIPNGGYEKYGIAAGDLLIVMSQIMFATKMIYEEKFIRKHSIHPMMFVGAEGVFGFVLAGIAFAIFNTVDATQYSFLPNGRLEDVVDAYYQFISSWQIIVAVFGSIITYVLYMYLGMFLIRDQGALPQVMIQSISFVLYWAICLALSWEQFFIAQVPGLCVVLIGVLIYAGILVLPSVMTRERINGLDIFQANLQEDNERDGDGVGAWDGMRGVGDGNGNAPPQDNDFEEQPEAGDIAANVAVNNPEINDHTDDIHRQDD